jgi:hypothetical protein
VTEGQTSIPVPPAPETGICQWCGAQTSNKLVLDKGNTRAANGVTVPKSTKWAWCCTTCDRRLLRREGAKT